VADLVGEHLAHYTITSRLGKGGMGEVFRATDSRLGREVALKVLPPEVANDRDRLARFEREARLLAALNHPNVATLYGLEEYDGRRFLVMELVTGESLAGRVARGRVPINEALELACQVARGFEAAHGQGIVHRDLKPANVMLSSEGTIKVLDFGLAKAFDPSRSGAPKRPESIDATPTLSVGTTRAGALLGTPAYMSPEQASGEPVDKRADIWAFGCLLWEMLSRRCPFTGSTSTEVLAAILKQEPEWNDLPSETPAPIRRLLRRCLAKDRRNRLHDISDARIVLQEVLSADIEPATAPGPALVRGGPAARVATMIGAAFGGAVATAALMVLLSPPDEQPPSTQSTRFVINPPAGTQVHESHYANPVDISPDGRQVVYVGTLDGTRRLYRRPMSLIESVVIPGTEGAECPRFSPDGSSVAFVADHSLKKVSLDDGVVTTICDARDVLAVCWADATTILFSQEYRTEVFSVSSGGGEPKTLSGLGSEVGLMSFTAIDVINGGEALVLTVETGGGIESERIDVVDTAAGVRRTLIESGDHGRTTTSNHLMFSRGDSIYAAPFDGDELDLAGPAMRVVEEPLELSEAADASVHFAVSENGTLVYLAGRRVFAGEPVWVDRQGRAEKILEEPRHFWAPMLSPDGRRLALSTLEEVMETWILDLNRRALSRFTYTGSNHVSVWSPDGKYIAFSSDRDGPYNLYLKPADGSGTAERLTVYDWHQDPASWSPDGRILAFAQYHPSSDWDIGLLHIGDEPRQEDFIKTPFREYHPMISPDGRWLAYVSDETGKFEVYVQPFPAGGSKWLVSVGGGSEPLWAHSGTTLFYRVGPKVMAVEIGAGSGFEAGNPRLLFEVDTLNTTGLGLPDYDVSSDGERFVMIAPVSTTPETEIYVTMNWFAEVNRVASPD
jgi:Tol biopolymer transport system component